MKNKKGLGIGVVVSLVLLLFILLVLLFLNRDALGKVFQSLSLYEDGTGDYDGDGIPNQFDKCDCKPFPNSNDGCPDGLSKSEIDAESKRCTAEIKMAKEAEERAKKQNN